MNRSISLLSLISFSTGLSHAAVTIIGGSIGPILDQTGSPVQLGAVGVLVADFSNDGVLNPFGTTLNVNSFVGNGTDDRILGVFSALDLSGAGDIGYDFSGVSWEYGGAFGAGDRLHFLWFPSVTTFGSIVSGGLAYGSFTSDLVDVSATNNWIAAPDGQNVSVVAFGASIGGSPSFPSSAFTATLTAIPEPSSFAALAGLAVLGMVATRRRRSA